MLKSMTGFGSSILEIPSLGKVSIELRSTNHKFLEVIIHLPEGLLSLEERIKREIEGKIKRGRITCVVTLMSASRSTVKLNRDLLKDYLEALKKILTDFKIKDELRLDTLLNLPGVLSLSAKTISPQKSWSKIRILLNQALDNLLKARQKEGQAIAGYLKRRARGLEKSLEVIKRRFKKVIKDKIAKLLTDEERTSFLKNTDITEEMERLKFHLRNFQSRLGKLEPVGKELDFIAQEMQREANTIAAKSCDVFICGRIIGMKSQIEKIREQLQNIE
ncbi:MAG: YicC family protein [Candidatus Omnitrophica bacterium]|nr:YicC family protein [Candidatus Omnitrophota bacterium]